MSRAVLQIPVSKTLRTRAEKAALDYGFSSLQEIMRVFMTKLAKKTIDVSFQEIVSLSPQAETRYEKIDKDFSMGKNVYLSETTKDLKSRLSR